MGQNGQIPLFAKIGSVLSLFKKYLAIYHLLKIRLYETRVSHCIFLIQIIHVSGIFYGT